MMVKKKRKSVFGANVLEDVKRRKRMSKGGSQYLTLPKDMKMFKETVGRIKLDVIPYLVTDPKHPDFNPDIPKIAEVGHPWYKRTIWVHRSVGVENESIICPKTVGKKCPICEERDRQLKEGIDYKDAISQASHRNIYIVVPVGHKNYDEDYHIWDISQFCFQDELDDELEEKPEYLNFPDPIGGYTLNTRFSEESGGGNFKFPKAGRVDFDDREDYPDEIWNDMPNLDEMFTVMSYKDIYAKFFGVDDDDIDDQEQEDDQEESPRKRKPRRKPKTTKEDGPEDEKPRRRRKVKEDDPEDEKPRRKKSGKNKKDPECPADYEFGKDWDKYGDCDDCKIFNDCMDANEKLEQ